mgnify:CR=1 FL=1
MRKFDQAGRGDRQPPLLLQVEHRALDDVHGGAAGDLRVGLDVGDEQLDRGRNAGAQPAASHRHYDRADVGQVLRDLEAHRALPRDDHRMVVGRHEGAPLVPHDLLCTAHPVRRRRPGQLHARPVTDGPLPLRRRNGGGHHDCARDPEQPGGERAVVNVLENEGAVGTVRGDTALIRGGKVVSFESEPVYYVGELSWWNWIWFYVSRVPLGVVLLGMLAGVLFAFWLYGALRRSAARRLQ